MNATHAPAKVTPIIDDVQGRPDTRRIPIDRVGIKDIYHPVRVKDRSGGEQTRRQLQHVRALPHDSRARTCRGSSRCSTITSARSRSSIPTHPLPSASASTRTTLTSNPVPVLHHEAVAGHRPAGPAGLQGHARCHANDGKIETWLNVVVPVTSLCPCSKQISDYGAHNQRSLSLFRRASRSMSGSKN